MLPAVSGRSGRGARSRRSRRQSRTTRSGSSCSTDIRAIFAERGVDRLPSAELVEALIAIEGRPWAEWKAGKPLSQNGLARLLKPLKIRPGTKRFAGEKTLKGYYLSDFDDAFSALSRPGGGIRSVTPSQCR